jgi:hypothetical protein
MIEYKRAELDSLAVHYIGNKGNGEEASFSKQLFKCKEEFVKETLVNFFLTPFKTDIYYQFGKSDAIKINDVHSYVSEVFDNRELFFNHSLKIAQHLYDQSNHPKLKGGEFYMAYFKDLTVDGELCDAIGIFKSENKETYLKVFQHLDEFEIETENGININKLDKGCLIFNTEREQGYKISVVDNSHRIAEAALYWTEDFLNLKMREERFYHTQQMLNTATSFCKEVLTEENNVERPDQMLVMNRSLNYFKEKDKFNIKEFENEVMAAPELVSAFREYKEQYNADNHLNDIEEFDISQTAVKKNQKFLKSVVKLDKNFHIYVHGRHDFIKKGFDDEKGMNFYTLYYNKEE